MRRPRAEGGNFDDLAALPRTTLGGEQGEGLGTGKAEEVVLAAIVDGGREQARLVVDRESDGNGPEAIVGRTMGSGPDGAKGRGGPAEPPWSRAIKGPTRRLVTVKAAIGLGGRWKTWCSTRPEGPTTTP